MSNAENVSESDMMKSHMPSFLWPTRYGSVPPPQSPEIACASVATGHLQKVAQTSVCDRLRRALLTDTDWSLCHCYFHKNKSKNSATQSPSIKCQSIVAASAAPTRRSSPSTFPRFLLLRPK